MRLEVAADIRSTFYAPDRQTAEKHLQAIIQKYAISAPRLSAWLEENLSEGFSDFEFPLEHLRSIRTINSLERINKEIRRRTRVVDVFPNEASCLRLISALLSKEWQTESIILLAGLVKVLWVFLTRFYRKKVA
jgi:transposase-like protein